MVRLVSHPKACQSSLFRASAIAGPRANTQTQHQGRGSHGGAEALTDPSMGLLMGRKDAQRFRNVVLGLKKGVYIRPSGAPLTIGAPPAT